MISVSHNGKACVVGRTQERIRGDDSSESFFGLRAMGAFYLRAYCPQFYIETIYQYLPTFIKKLLDELLTIVLSYTLHYCGALGLLRSFLENKSIDRGRFQTMSNPLCGLPIVNKNER